MKLRTVFIWMVLSTVTSALCQEKKIEAFNPEIIYTQEKVDSILFYVVNNARKIKDYSDIKKILNSDKELSGWTHYYFLKSKQYHLSEVYDSAVVYADKGIKYYEELKRKRDFDERILLDIYLYKGKSLSRLGEFGRAILSSQKALDFTKKYSYPWKSFIISDIASCHLEIGNDSIALNYYLRASKDSLYMSLDRSAVTNSTRIGVIYANFQNTKEAKVYYSKAIKRSEESTYKNNLWVLYNNLGDIYKDQSDIDSTLFYYKKSIASYTDDMQSPVSPIHVLNYLKGYVNLYEGDITTSVNNFNAILESYDLKKNKSKDEKDLILNTYEALAIAYQKKNNVNGLQAILKESNVFLETFYENQLQTNLNDLEIKYQTKEKDISIASLEEVTQNQEVIIQQRNTISWVLGGLLISFIGLGYLFFRQRQLQNKYKASNLEQRLLRSQLNPHFLFNALNSVSGLVQKKSEQTIPYISKLGELLRSILENSREEFITLEEEIETLSTYLELQSDFSKKFTFSIEVDETLDRDETLIPPMFIQPFIENSIQHGFKGGDSDRITIHIEKQDKLLYCHIEDNGVGYATSIKNKDTSLGHKSLSGKILQERLALYAKTFKTKATYRINDVVNDNGTEVALWLPYIKDV